LCGERNRKKEKDGREDLVSFRRVQRFPLLRDSIQLQFNTSDGNGFVCCEEEKGERSKVSLVSSLQGQGGMIKADKVSLLRKF